MTEKVIVEDGSRYVDAMDEILALIKGRVPIIWVLTHEENRFIEDFQAKIAKPYKRQLWIWSATQGLVQLKKQMTIAKASGSESGTHVAVNALGRIIEMDKDSLQDGEEGICFIMRDMHTVLGGEVVRQMRDVFEHMIGLGKTIIIVSPVLAHEPGGVKPGVPPTLEKQISVVHYELPNLEEIKALINSALDEMRGAANIKDKNVNLDYTDEEILTFAKALRGLTFPEIYNAISTSMTHLKQLNVTKLIGEKKQIIAKSEILEFVETDANLSDVGGLDLVKAYLQRYVNAQSDEAKEFGVEPLRGVIFSGVAGTGKSLLSKVTGQLFQLPLLRLDVGRVMGSLVGQSESRMREVVKVLKSMRPCLCWIDEVEKSLSGTKSSNYSDGGTLSRVFGTLLHAMQEELDGVTLIATSNDISVLPPEFIRRFDDLFFVDLPGPDERWEIFDIHLRKRGRDIKNYEKYKQQILKASLDYTGAEIEKSVKAAIASAFHAGHKGVTHQDIIAALEETKPIAKTQKDKISKIREKARGNYRYASSWAEEESKTRKVRTKSGKKLDINSALDDLPEVKSKQKKN